MDKAASDDGRHSDMSKGGATELTSPSGFGFSPESQARGCSGRGMTEGTGTVPGEQGQMVYLSLHCKEQNRRLVLRPGGGTIPGALGHCPERGLE